MARRSSSEKTEKLIQDALIDIYLEKNRNLNELSVSAISKRAGIARTTFYTYYDDPYAVMQDIQDTLMEGLDEIDQRADRIRLGDGDYSFSTFGTVDTLRYLAEHRKTFVALLCDGGEPLFVHKVKSHICHHLKTMISRSKVNLAQPDIVESFVGGAVLEANCYWLKERPDLSPEEASSVILDLVDACLPVRR